MVHGSSMIILCPCITSVNKAFRSISIQLDPSWSSLHLSTSNYMMKMIGVICFQCPATHRWTLIHLHECRCLCNWPIVSSSQSGRVCGRVQHSKFQAMWILKVLKSHRWKLKEKWPTAIFLFFRSSSCCDNVVQLCLSMTSKFSFFDLAWVPAFAVSFVV